MPISIKQEGGVQKHIENLGYDWDEFNRDMQLELPIQRIAKILSKLAGKNVTRHSVGKWAKEWKREREAS